MRAPIALLVSLLALDLHAAVSGRVTAEDGTPIAGARVRAFVPDGTSEMYARLLSDKPEREPVATTETKADGTFSIDAKAPVIHVLADAPGRLQAGTFAVDGDTADTLVLHPAAKKRGRVTSGGRPVANALVVLNSNFLTRTDAEGWYEAPDPTLWAERAFVIHRDHAIAQKALRMPRATLDFELERGVTLRGRTVGADRKPVAGAVISVDGWPLGSSGEDGAFAIPNVPTKWRALTAVTGSLAGLVLAPAPATEVVMRPAATLSGTVRSTKDNAFIGGAQLTLTYDADGVQGVSIPADAKGAFTTPALPAGTYRVTTFHPTHTGGFTTVRLDGATTRHLALTPLSRITGTVVDEERKPVAGALIRTGSGPSAVTSADGRFSARVGPRTRETMVMASKRGYAMAIAGPFTLEPGEVRNVPLVLPRGFAFRVRLVDRAGEPVPAEPVALSLAREDWSGGPHLGIQCPDDPSGRCRTAADGLVDLRLTQAKYEIVAGGEKVPVTRLPAQELTAEASPLTITVDRGVRVDGRVTFSDGAPATGLPNLVVVARGGMDAPAQVQEDGTFVFTNVRPGPLTLQAQASGMSIAGATKEITAPATGVVLTIAKPSRIEGRVTERGSRQPVREFTVGAMRQGGGRPPRSTPVRSDDGTFVLEGVLPGTNELVVTAPGFVQSITSNLTVEEGKELTGVEVQLDRGGTVSGRVTANGQPLADVNVEAEVRMTGPMPRPQSARSDANGDYTLEGVAAGERSIRFSKDGFVPEKKTVAVGASKESRLDVELSRGRELRGRVIDAAGAPVAGARLRPEGRSAEPSSYRVVTSDAEGAFKLEGLSPHWRGAVIAEKEGYLAATAEDVDVMSNAVITLTLTRGGTITGRVVGVPENEMAFVSVVTFGGRARATTRPDPAGNFTLEGVPNGRVTISAQQYQPRSRRTQPKTVEVVNGTAAPVTLDFAGGYIVRGRVRRGGAPVEVGSVEFIPQPAAREGDMQTGSAMIGADGMYEASVEAGRYRVLVVGPMLRAEAGEVTVGGNMTHDIDLTGATVRGRVIDAATGTPIAGASLRLDRITPGWPGRNATSDSNGTFAFDLLPDEIYRLRTGAERYAAESQEVIVRGGSAADVEVRMHAGDRIAVYVVDAVDSRPIDATVTVLSGKEIAYSGSPTRAEDGSLNVWLTPGRYSLRVWANGYLPATQDLVAPGTARVALTRAGRIVVRSSRPDAVRARAVSATTKNRMVMRIPPGTFESIAPGEYVVELLDQRDEVLDRKNASVTGGQTTTVTF